MTENDTSLTAAAEEAVAADEVEVVEEEAVETETDEQDGADEVVEQEEPDEVLPDDNKERSKLGRKLSALHRRNDQLEENITALTEMMKRLVPEAPEDESANEYVTRKDLENVIAQPKKQAQKYEQDYMSAFTEVGEGLDLDDAEIENVWAHMLENNNKQVKGDPVKDASINFFRSYKQMNEKKMPLKKGTPSGVIKRTASKSTATRTQTFDPATEAYLKMIKQRDGVDKEIEARKELSK